MALYLTSTPDHDDAFEVTVCSEDGTVYDPKFMCPTCALRPDGRWGD